MGEGASPLPVCDRCRHFVVRAEGLQTCLPCRKGYQLLVSLRSVVAPNRDEAAAVFLEGCFGLLEDWIKEIKNLEDKDSRGSREKPKREEKPQDKEKPLAKPERKEGVLKQYNSPHKEKSDRPHPETSRPSSSSKQVVSRPPLPPPPPAPEAPQGSLDRGHSSQVVRVPRPSHRGQDIPADRPDKRPAPAPQSKRASPAEGAEAGEVTEEPISAKKDRSRRRRRKRERSSSSPSSRGRDKKRRRESHRDKKDRSRRRRRSRTGTSSVTGSRVREAKKEEAVRLRSPEKPRSPHTPPGPPPAPPPVRQPPARPPPVRPPRRQPVPQGPGWVGRVPYSNHPRWWAGKNKGVTRRAKQELFNRRR